MIHVICERMPEGNLRPLRIFVEPELTADGKGLLIILREQTYEDTVFVDKDVARTQYPEVRAAFEEWRIR